MSWAPAASRVAVRKAFRRRNSDRPPALGASGRAEASSSGDRDDLGSHRGGGAPADGGARDDCNPARDVRQQSNPNRQGSFIGLVVVLFTLAVLRRAWMCDDAFIMMRSVDNLVEGRGFVFNVSERVLGFTNPLWALLVALPYSLIRNPYLVPVVLGVLIAAATATLIAWHGSHDKRPAALVLVALCFSRAFVDFSTSGLENSLSHLLLVAFFFTFLQPRSASLLTLSALGALAIVNRLDLALFVLPAVAIAWWRLRGVGAHRDLVLGFAPALAWFCFAFVYYGFPLPNTVYAKLNTRIPQQELAQQGLAYLVDVVTNDIQSAIIVLAAMTVLAARARTDKTARVVLVSLLLGLTYIVVIGGDFMSGRFLTPSIAVSAAVLTHYGQQLLSDRGRLWVAAASVAGIVLSISFSPFRDDPLGEKREIPIHRIVNERAWYQEHLALMVNLRPVAWREDGLFLEGRRAREQHHKVTVFGNIGMYSWGAGPDTHVVDDLALTDPLLARIPFPYSPDWRTGHLGRAVPPGYLESLEQGSNRLQDPCLAHYYDRLSRVIHGPLFTWERFRAITQLNLPGGITVRRCPGSALPEPPLVAQR